MPDTLTIQDLYIYPIKSLAGIRLSEAKVEERGFELDRRWMLIDKEGKFLSQRTFPMMAMLKVELGKDFLSVYHVSYPSKLIQIPFEEEGEEVSSVTVWDDEMSARLVNPEVDQWFSQMLEMKVRLVKMPLSTERKVDSKYAVNDESVSFADGMPYLLIGQESLNDLNGRLVNSVPMNRFRPTFVFTGGAAFDEDNWKTIKIGEVLFYGTEPCGRCNVTTIDQNTAQTNQEPLRTLSMYRKEGSKVKFGMNLIGLSTGTVQVGDKIAVMEANSSI